MIHKDEERFTQQEARNILKYTSMIPYRCRQCFGEDWHIPEIEDSKGTGIYFVRCSKCGFLMNNLVDDVLQKIKDLKPIDLALTKITNTDDETVIMPESPNINPIDNLPNPSFSVDSGYTKGHQRVENENRSAFLDRYTKTSLKDKHVVETDFASIEAKVAAMFDPDADFEDHPEPGVTVFSNVDPNKESLGKFMAGVLADFAPALKEVAKLGSMNNKPNGKYERGSWMKVQDPEVMYKDAFWRHLLDDPNTIDPTTGMYHDVAVAWNALALVWFRLKRYDEAKAEAEEVERVDKEYMEDTPITDTGDETEALATLSKLRRQIDSIGGTMEADNIRRGLDARLTACYLLLVGKESPNGKSS